mmetsp:Transcript_22832/g.58133  ORF Transcript_22832/g.58133 Transcript_22832/m.58133 type:complete len:249 (+) Transcript_22832:101-847(+)
MAASCWLAIPLHHTLHHQLPGQHHPKLDHEQRGPSALDCTYCSFKPRPLHSRPSRLASLRPDQSPQFTANGCWQWLPCAHSRSIITDLGLLRELPLQGCDIHAGGRHLCRHALAHQARLLLDLLRHLRTHRAVHGLTVLLDQHGVHLDAQVVQHGVPHTQVTLQLAHERGDRFQRAHAPVVLQVAAVLAHGAEQRHGRVRQRAVGRQLDVKRVRRVGALHSHGPIPRRVHCHHRDAAACLGVRYRLEL